ncbi:sphingosine N-acyltransferase lag1 [Rhizina undulata]
MARERRKSSSLGQDIRGDTSAPSFSTMSTSSAQVRSFSSLQSSTRQKAPFYTLVNNGKMTPRIRQSVLGWSATDSWSTLQRAASRSRRRALSKDRRSTRSRTRTFFTWYREVSYRNTWLNPLVAMIIVVLAYAFNPSASNPLHACLFLSYPLPPDPESHSPNSVQYGKGKKDILFVLFYTFFFSFTREFLMQRVLHPLAKRWNITRKSKISRFMEQSYTAVYFSVFAPYGLYVMYNTPIWYFNTTAFYEKYPHYTHTADFKAYYLLQAAYWSQQAIVLMLQLEKPRKDFKELVMHHVVTLALIGLSYRFHFTWMGIAVFVTHDISDFFLATSKTLNYLDYEYIGPYFGFFIFVWIYMRHYINLGIIWSVLTEFRTVGTWELNWETQTYKSRFAQLVCGSLLGSLQAVNLFWLWLILKIAKRYVLSSEAVDERSDDEAEDEEASDDITEIDTPRIEVTMNDDEMKKEL